MEEAEEQGGSPNAEGQVTGEYSGGRWFAFAFAFVFIWIAFIWIICIYTGVRRDPSSLL